MTLILSPEPLGAEMAGMAIRATELARAIGGEAVYSHPHAPGDLRRPRGRRRRRGRAAGLAARARGRCGARARG